MRKVLFVQLVQSSSIFRSIPLFLVFVLLSACGNGAGSGISTHTPSPSPSATCDAGFMLSTPEGWKTQSNLVVLLYDPTSMRNEGLVLETIAGATDDVEEFSFYIANKLFHQGVAAQVSIFELGWRSYEEARRVRITTPIQRPELYDTPSPLATVTPYPTNVNTPESGLEVIQATNEARRRETEHAQAAELVRQLNGCAQIVWDTVAKHTATAWAATEAVERERASQTLQPPSMVQVQENLESTPSPTPYSRQSVYDGLWHATIDFNAECANYDRCIFIIVDDLRTWGVDNPNNRPIDFTGVEIYALMPDCRDINQPSCVELQQYWTSEFLKYGAIQVGYFNGERAEFRLDELLGR